MCRYDSSDNGFTFEEQIRSLADEELLDFWVESQDLAKMAFPEEAPVCDQANPEYERIIIQELQLRTSMRTIR